MYLALRAFIAALAAVLVSGCGGGGGGAESGPVASTASFPVQSAHRADVLAGGTTTFTVSGTCSGTATLTEAPAVAASFEGTPGYTSNDTFTLRLSNCAPSTISSTGVTFYDGNFSPLAMLTVGEEYTRFQSPPAALPAQVRVGDTATYATYVVYTDSTMATATGTRVFSYVVEPDTADTAIVNFVSKDFDTVDRLTVTGQSRYRLTSSGVATLVSQEVVAGTNRLVMTSNGRVAPSAVRIGGTVTGLAGTGLVLQMNGANELPVTADGSFEFPGTLGADASYIVTIKAHPSSPTQTCSLLNASGSTSSTAVTSIRVQCVSNTYALGGTVTGLLGTGLVLQNNAGSDLSITADGGFAFASPVTSGATYRVSVKSQPLAPQQACAVTNAEGTVVASNISTLQVNCVTVAGGSSAGFIYLGSDADQTVSALAIDPATGALVPIGSRLTLGGFRMNLAADPAGRFVYATADMLYIYRRDPVTGRLSPAAGSPIFAFTPSIRGMTSDGRFAYGRDNTPQYGIYAVDTVTGLLSPTVNFVPQTDISDFAFSADGKHAYLSTLSSNATIAAFDIDSATGLLAPIQGSPYPLANVGAYAQRIVVTADGLNVYGVVQTDATVWGYARDPVTGALSRLVGSPYTVPPRGVPQVGGSGPADIAIHPTGKFAYVSRFSLGGLMIFDRNVVTGVLTLRSLTPVPTGTNPSRILMHPSGAYLYVLNHTSSVSAYAIDPASGALSPVPGSPFAATFLPTSILLIP